MIYRFALLIIAAAVLISGCAKASTEPLAPAGHEAVVVAGAQDIVPDPAKKVYLTFDDGPNSYFTKLILDILKQSGVKATFVVIGSNIEKNPEVFKRILDEGHSVVNHTFCHDYKKLYESPEAFLSDLDRCDKIITAFGGKAVKIYRAPGGSSRLNQDFYEFICSSGYKTLDWNVSSADSDPKGIGKEQLVSNVKNGVINMEKMEKAPIILMHDGTEIYLGLENPGEAVENYIRSRESDVAALPEIIDFLKSRGYTFAGVDEHTPPAW
ncbi:polysaccharide deacetylase family protein [Pelotomaculum propionicicum]|uniref:polysaccharide deacetylase family protein n=1 Tax=Pelotomaculum propionicicum TaxID=258475 RepID=UPI003B7CDB6E